MIRDWRRVMPIGVATMGLLGMLLAVGASPATAAPKAKVTTVASGFDNPRGLAFGEEGTLYVGEAGKGGPKCIPGGPDGATCPGLTSAISVIKKSGAHHRIVSGLLSVSGQGGMAATGVDGISFNEDTGLYGIITGCPQQVAQVPPGQFDPKLLEELKDQAGQLINVHEPGEFNTVAPVGRVDWQWTIDHHTLVPKQFPDCNPYGVLAQGKTEWVVDAASNTIDRVVDGHVTVEKFVPSPAVSDAVPTCIARGPDRALYVSQLTGAGNPPGSASVWRFDPQTRALDKWATGLTSVTGCGFGPDGQFYATEFSQQGFESFKPFTGAVVRVPRHSTSPIVVADGLSFPNGFAAKGDAIYVSNWSVCTASPPPVGPCANHPGAVVKIGLNEGGDD